MKTRLARFRRAYPTTFVLSTATAALASSVIVAFALSLASNAASDSSTSWVRKFGDVLSMVSFFASLVAVVMLFAYPVFIIYTAVLGLKDRRDRPYNGTHASTKDESG